MSARRWPETYGEAVTVAVVVAMTIWLRQNALFLLPFWGVFLIRFVLRPLLV